MIYEIGHFFKHLLLSQQDAYRILSLRSVIPFMVLQIITRIANVNLIREENEKYLRFRHEKKPFEGEKVLPVGKLIKEMLLYRTQKKKQYFSKDEINTRLRRSLLIEILRVGNYRERKKKINKK